MNNALYELSPNDIYKIIRISTKLKSAGQIIEAFEAVVPRQRSSPHNLEIDMEDEPDIDLKVLENVPEDLHPVADALFGAVSDDSADLPAEPPLSLA